MEKNDKRGYDSKYKNKTSKLYKSKDIHELMLFFEKDNQPFYLGGTTKGYIRRLAIQRIVDDCKMNHMDPAEVTVLDAGCGLGALSVYLAAHRFNMVGVDISDEAVKSCEETARKFGLENKCKFIATSLENIPIADDSIDYIIGHGALHHFIKYEKVPAEFHRVMKDRAKGYFADGFGENKLYHLFHDKKEMEELGDATLTRKLVYQYFRDFEVHLLPTDWFVMLDKLFLKIIPAKQRGLIRKLSSIHFKLDRKINTNSVTLYLSGAVLTEIINHKDTASTRFFQVVENLN